MFRELRASRTMLATHDVQHNSRNAPKVCQEYLLYAVYTSNGNTLRYKQNVLKLVEGRTRYSHAYTLQDFLGTIPSSKESA